MLYWDDGLCDTSSGEPYFNQGKVAWLNSCPASTGVSRFQLDRCSVSLCAAVALTLQKNLLLRGHKYTLSIIIHCGCWDISALSYEGLKWLQQLSTSCAPTLAFSSSKLHLGMQSARFLLSCFWFISVLTANDTRIDKSKMHTKCVILMQWE